jgi:transcriptional regulator with PAS, ATPase and Fis domain
MIPLMSKPKDPPIRLLPKESDLRTLLANGMVEAVQQILDINPELKYRIENGLLVDSVTGATLWLKKFITEDEETLVMKSDAMKLAKVDDEVLITGETGTGKEIIARAMIGDREGKFQRINCAAMPESLIEAELFGHVKGAYTGAESSKPGMILSANNGVMFLDEVGDLPLTTQAKLLNVLQPVDGKRYVRPIGATDEKEISCRFVCATHRDLKDMVEKNLFRKDLYARISTFELHIKPLIERKKDIVLIVLAIGELLKISQKAKEFLEKYEEDIMNNKIDLSLNVRSLEQLLKRYNVLGKI